MTRLFVFRQNHSPCGSRLSSGGREGREVLRGGREGSSFSTSCRMRLLLKIKKMLFGDVFILFS